MHVVTGGAGFIGSHLVDGLAAAGHRVHAIDDLSAGDARWLDRSKATLAHADAADPAPWATVARDHAVETVWHLAADPEVRRGADDPGKNVRANVDVTFAVLEAMRRHDMPHLAFTSTSTVYGQADVRPTPEGYGPLLPISIYGGCKLACEGLIAAYCGTYGLRAQLFRFANVVGPRSNHGVTYDFVAKLRADEKQLEVLGDGTQTKSYVHVADTVSGMLAGVAASGPGCTAWNIGSLDAIPVTQVARIVADAMGVRPTLRFTGGGHGGAGWAGDVKHMGLAVDALRATGWHPTRNSAQAIADTAAWLVAQGAEDSGSRPVAT